MYKKSIKNNANFLIPFLQGIKLYGSNDILSNVGTMIVINENGTLLTCKHIAEEIRNAQMLSEEYPKLLKKLKKFTLEEKREFEEKNKLFSDTCVLSCINWFFNIEKCTNIHIVMHPILDLAIIKFEGIKFVRKSYPVFSSKLPDIGQSVCKLGYAFANVDLFEYDEKKETIIIKNNGYMELPLFPIDGIVTRHLNVDIDNNNYRNVMFETSSPGLRGQSGGPIFSPEGVIFGIQSITSHVDLNFDINTEVKRGNTLKNVTLTPFMNLGIGVSSVEIIKFLEDNNIEFNKK